MSLDVLLRGQLNFLNQYFDVVAVSGGEEQMNTVRTREQVQIREVSMQRGISPYRDLVSLYKLFRLFRKEKPDIVHSITPKAGLLSMIAAKLAGVPIRVHTFTGLIFPSKIGLLQLVLITMDKILCACATAIYPEGQGVRQDLINYGITHIPLEVLANGNINGVDFSHYDYHSFQESELLNKRHYDLDNKLVFLNIGRMVKDKGIIELLRSFITLYDEGNNVALLLVGSLEQDLDPLPVDVVYAIEHHSGITWVGYQSDVRPFIAMSDVLVFPSYREGFPNVPLQCGAFKKAMILSDISGCNEIVTHLENGLLVKPKSEEEVYSAMRYMLNNTDERINFGQEAYAYIKENFEQSTVWQAQLESYNSLIKNR
jgi:glycosyltransferase involved in cell wall biosynthesis